MKILVIDDERSVTKIVARVASDLGFVVETLNDPSLAFDIFEAFKPDILLLDMLMPEVDGVDVLNEILACGTDAFIVIMSGYGKACLQLGKSVAKFHDHRAITTLAKPFRRADLIALLESHSMADPVAVDGY
jgi:two-component system response regulator VicR